MIIMISYNSTSTYLLFSAQKMYTSGRGGRLTVVVLGSRVEICVLKEAYYIQIGSMLMQNSKNRSRCSSSSSGSMKLIPEHQLERYQLKSTHNRDLFDLLLDQNQQCSEDHSEIFRTISQMNLSPRQHPHQGCKCTKIDCLKMYCECFAKGRLCNQKCQCYTCCNKQDCRLQIYKAQQLANFRHPGTFKGVPAWIPERRCTCKKSGCRKNYCECYRAGIKCGQECQCVMCQNGKPHSHDDFMDSRMEIQVNA